MPVTYHFGQFNITRSGIKVQIEKICVLNRHG
ncbi:Uncharacterised protein [Enterobacter hormaechei]|nr:Uncharacterised protein [Enterobacter hormaechei]CZW34859.1 Uncharacterised protein [Enterobacter hormaechei]SAB56490.1 Uncharacterised protein [Enterobacter hormaechei]SAB67244.1 Uncharacterised protein [Enterobacter hormaechei]SAC22540.1 Uncharacterised protein [Enterobacter hormaechei]